MNVRVYEFGSGEPAVWNDFVESSNEGTLFHRLDFLAYHQNRFRDAEHHLAIEKDNRLLALMPMTIERAEGGQIARSPYGGSYGGPVFARPPSYAVSRAVVEALFQYLSSAGVESLTMVLPLLNSHRSADETFRFALLESGVRCVSRDISHVVPLAAGEPWQLASPQRRNKGRKAQRQGVTLHWDAPVGEFAEVLRRNFAKHGQPPTHTEAQLQWLREHLPERIRFDVARFEGRPAAGVAHFVINSRMDSSFYLVQDPECQDSQALSYLVLESLQRCCDAGFKWFDFGTSSVGMTARPNVFQFKEGFEARQFRETYRWTRNANSDE